MDESNAFELHVFEGTEHPFKAYYDAVRWCSERGISVGSMQANAPTGLVVGSARISKWSNMTPDEREALDGTISAEGRFRHGKVTLRIKRSALQRVKS